MSISKRINDRITRLDQRTKDTFAWTMVVSFFATVGYLDFLWYRSMIRDMRTGRAVRKAAAK